MPRALCAGCACWVDTRGLGVAEQVIGYRVNRGAGAGGGTNAIALPKSLGQWLCPACLDVAKGNSAQHQGQLF